MIGPTITSLLQQTMQADIIQLNLPRLFVRNNETFPKNITGHYPILMHPQIRIVWHDDMGPVSKLVPTLQTETNPDTLIIIVDDDTVYPLYMVTYMKERVDVDPNFVQTGHCGDGALTNKEEVFFRPPFNWTKPTVKTKKQCCCRLHLGFGGVAYRRGFFDNPHLPFDRYLNIALRNPYCYRGDDFVVSNYLAMVGYQGLALRLKVSQQRHGFDADALHKLEPEAIERYSICSQYLQLHNISFLRTRNDQL